MQIYYFPTGLLGTFSDKTRLELVIELFSVYPRIGPELIYYNFGGLVCIFTIDSAWYLDKNLFMGKTGWYSSVLSNFQLAF